MMNLVLNNINCSFLIVLCQPMRPQDPPYITRAACLIFKDVMEINSCKNFELENQNLQFQEAVVKMTNSVKA